MQFKSQGFAALAFFADYGGNIMKKRLASLLTAVLLLVSLVPAGVFADENDAAGEPPLVIAPAPQIGTVQVKIEILDDIVKASWEPFGGTDSSKAVLLQKIDGEFTEIASSKVLNTFANFHMGDLTCYKGGTETDEYMVQVQMLSNDRLRAEGQSEVFETGRELLEGPQISFSNGGVLSIQHTNKAVTFISNIYTVEDGQPKDRVARWVGGAEANGSQFENLVVGQEYMASVSSYDDTFKKKESAPVYSGVVVFAGKKCDVPLSTVDFYGKLEQKIAEDTIGTMSEGVKSYSTDWFYNGAHINKPFVVKDGFYNATLYVNAEDGKCFTYDTAVTVFGKTLLPGLLSDAGKTAVYYIDDLKVATINTLPIINKNPRDAKSAGGAPVFFNVEAENGTSYQWVIKEAGVLGEAYNKKDLEDHAAISGDRTSSLTLTPYDTFLNGAEIYCIVKNSEGSVASGKAVLSVSLKGEEEEAPAYVFPFTDVKKKDWFYEDVEYANKTGLVSGKSESIFAPNDNMTYAEAIKLAACMNEYYKNGKVTLEDSESGNWYDSYVAYAKANGIPADYSNYKAPVSREEYVHIFYSAMPASEYVKKNDITKIWDVDGFYSYEILAFYRAGILTGNDDKGTFAPQSNIKRCQVAAILTRMMDKEARLSFTPAE